MSPARLRDGGEGEAIAWSREVLHLVLPRAFAPGAPLALTLELDGGALELTGKTIGSKRREDGRFDVRARLISLRRGDRARLEAIGG